MNLLRLSTHWEDFLNSFVVFSIDELTSVSVFDLQEINQIWQTYYHSLSDKSNDKKRICLVTGQNTAMAPILPTIKKGIGGKNDVPLVSINISSAESYGFEKSANAPISVSAASALTGALNYLVENPTHHLTIGDTKLLFWAESYDPFAEIFGQLLDKRPDSGESKELSSYLDSLRKGKLPYELQNKGRFFVLGLAPNSARISVRFWHVDNIDSLALKIGKHFSDVQIIPDKKDIQTFNPSLWQLLIETAVRHESQNIKPNLAGPFLQSILTGTPYPTSLLALLMDRVRSEQDSQKTKKIGLYRAAFIKAILNRNYSKEITMSLDTSRNSIPYLLGRLFAVLEKIQEEALGGNVNATIKDKYFASASTTPRRVFPLLIKLTQNHLKKLSAENKGRAVNKEKLLGEIMDRLQNFPSSLALEDQGEFSIGYYHQRQDFFKKKEHTSTETED
ncbi:MAG: type I-C CRISPR-associated protein Cas8c/Csd1 [Calditrichaeota bacterium]|nr:MAG: type I-C CRISPR-associated protein Cas8c/Csd1 [Calditrichota bacterium]